MCILLNDLPYLGIEAQLKSHSYTAWAGGELPLYVYSKISMALTMQIKIPNHAICW